MKVGFIGLGTMGGPMALNAQKGGHELIVNDLRRDCAKPHLERGARWADSAREVAAQSEIILTSLPGPREVEAMSEDLLQTMRKDAAWFDLSTNSPTVVRRCSASGRR